MNEIQHIDSLEKRQDLTEKLADRKEELKCMLSGILENEEVMWKTQVNKRWPREGDENTKFFSCNGKQQEMY